MGFATINPLNNILVKRFKQDRWSRVKSIINKAEFGFELNRSSALSIRSKRLNTVSEILIAKQDSLAKLMCLEMGKPILEAKAEIEKCSAVCRYYAERGRHFLSDEHVKTEYSKSFISYSPLGVLLGIMPWNFPFWQVFRFAAPALMAGNSIILKHAPNVPQCALAISEIFREASFPEGIFQNVFIDHKKVRWLIEDPRIQGISLTGSELAGAKVAEIAGRNIKKIVLELGGSDPFIVLDDANLASAAESAVKSRMINGGQSCIAAKRMIVDHTIIQEFEYQVAQHIRELRMGDPLEPLTKIGPLAREDLAQKLAKQVKESMRQGAEAIIGGLRHKNQSGAFFPPTLLTNVKPGMPAFDEELFGPVACITSFKNEEEAIRLANLSDYGLGASIWTVNKAKAQRLARQVQAGAVFINEMVKSDPRLPFGGIKRSGFGRELAKQGILEFVNIKTIVES